MAGLCRFCRAVWPTFRRFIGISIWVSVCFCASGGSGQAQQVWVRVYENEEDLWESFQEGEIAEEQWRELLDLFRGGTDSVFQPSFDIE